MADGDTRGEKSSNCLMFFRKNLLLLLVLLGVAVGFGLGFGLRPLQPSNDASVWIGLPGELYMRMLKLTILPLIVSSIITGTASMDAKSNGRIGMVSLIFIITTNAVGAVLSIILFFTFRPGDGIELQGTEGTVSQSTHIETSDMFADMIRNLFPDNIVTACFQKTQTIYSEKNMTETRNNTNITITVYKSAVGTTSGVNILGLVIVCTLLGMAAAKAGEVGQPFIAFFQAVTRIVIIILHWFIWFTPVGVASLIAASLIKVNDIVGAFRSLGLFIGAFTTGIFVHQLVLIPVLYLLYIRQNPFRLIFTCIRPWMTAFAPPSTAIAMPEMFNTLNKENVDQRVSRFVVPFGATLTRPGSCMFICLSALFLIRLEGLQVTANQVILTGILSTVGSLAIPAVPSASIVTILVVLSSINIQTYNIGLLMALEWYTDRLRTTSNTLTVIMAAIFVNRSCRDVLTRSEDGEEHKVIDKTIQISTVQTKL